MLNSYYKVLAFPSKYGYYYRFFFQNGTIRSYPNNYLTVDENALSNSSADPLFDYYRKAAVCNDLRSDDGELILKRVYEGLHFISQRSILAAYLNRKAVKHFPFSLWMQHEPDHCKQTILLYKSCSQAEEQLFIFSAD